MAQLRFGFMDYEPTLEYKGKKAEGDLLEEVFGKKFPFQRTPKTFIIEGYEDDIYGFLESLKADPTKREVLNIKSRIKRTPKRLEGNKYEFWVTLKFTY